MYKTDTDGLISFLCRNKDSILTVAIYSRIAISGKLAKNLEGKI